jgi:hypothetical protein
MKRLTFSGGESYIKQVHYIRAYNTAESHSLGQSSYLSLFGTAHLLCKGTFSHGLLFFCCANYLLILGHCFTNT